MFVDVLRNISDFLFYLFGTDFYKDFLLVFVPFVLVFIIVRIVKMFS